MYSNKHLLKHKTPLISSKKMNKGTQNDNSDLNQIQIIENTSSSKLPLKPL